jgi:tetratricopeptide (TPR) repeat protein
MIPQSQSSHGISPLFLQKLLILAAGIWVFSPAFHGDWLWDDNVLITENPLMSDPAGLSKIWFQPETSADYYPITFTLQRLEWNLWGNDTLGYHLVTFGLHLVNVLLVWRLLSKLGLRQAWLGGLVFAVHPVQVESVAWVAELKNTLSMTPFLLAMCAWVDYDRLGRRRDYLPALAFFLVALLCKITVVMFPVIILLYAWWRRGRVGWRDLQRSLPFFALSLAMGLIPILTGSWNRGFAHLGPAFVPAGGALGRFALAGQEIVFYFSKCVWPVGLLPVYPKWEVDPFSPVQYLPWVVLIGVFIWFWMKRRTWGRHALFGGGFFVINLLPCPGFIPAPNMAYAWVMDHFLYLPLIGLIGVALAAVEAVPEPPGKFASACRTAAVVFIVIVFAASSHAYSQLYGNSMRLWTYAARHNPDSWMVHLNLGEAFAATKQFPEAIDHFETALAIFPAYIGIRYDLASALEQSGRFSDAITQYEMVAKVHPDYYRTSFLLGQVLVKARRVPEATDQFEKLVQREPRNAEAHAALGEIYLKSGRLREATDQFAQASALDGASGDLHYVLGNALLKANRLPEALDQYQQAARLSPRDPDVLGDLGVVLARLGRFPEAAQQFELMLQIDPNSPAAHTNMGSLFLTVGKLPEAIAQYQEALRLQPDFTEAQQDLARAEAMRQARQPAPR